MTESEAVATETAEPDSAAPAATLRAWREELLAMARPDPLLDLDDDHPGTLDVTRAHPSGLAQLLAGRTTRLSALFREPASLSRARRRARDVRLAAAELSDAHGIDGCRIGLGVLRARAVGAHGPVRVSAPVLLRRASLVPRGAGSDDDIELGSDLVANPALLRWLGSAGVHVDGDELVRLALGKHGLDPGPALRLLQREARHLDGLQVSARLVIGLFVDVVPAMVEAVDGLAARLGGHDLLAALAGDTAASGRLQSARHAPAPSVDDGVPAVDLVPEAERAWATVLGGGSLRVEAPPGTGATQLVTAVIASAAARGWRTLLVCPQRHEVADVVRRLADAGMPGLVDDDPLGGRHSSPRDDGPSTDNPDRPTTNEPSGEPPAGVAGEPPTGPADASNRLLARHDALHAPDTWWQVSLLDALRAVADVAAAGSRPRTTTSMPVDAAMRVRHDRAGVRDRLRRAAALGAFGPRRDLGLWAGAALRDTTHAEQVVAVVRRLATTGLPALREHSSRTATAAGLAQPASVDAASDQVELLTGVQQTLAVFERGVFERQVDRMVAATAPAGQRRDSGDPMGLLERRRWRGQARELVRPGVRAGDLHAALASAAEQRQRWQALGGAGGWPQVPGSLAAAKDAVAVVLADLAVLEPVLAGGPAGPPGMRRMPLADLAQRVSRLAAGADVLPGLGEEAAVLVGLRDVGLDDLLADLRRRQVPVEDVGAELDLCWWRTVLEALLAKQSSAVAAELTGAGLEQAVQTCVDVAAAPRAGVVERLRRLAATGERPCLARSPYHPGDPAARYDLVVLAGAHRTGTAEAVAALALAPRALVVGDPGGVPPSAPRLGGPARDELAPPHTSVLTATVGLLPTLRLRWQHRLVAEVDALAATVDGSRGEREDGDDATPVLVPSPLGSAAVRLEHVRSAATADHGGQDDDEVARVVALVLDHVVHRPQESLAVVALDRVHARRIADALRADLPEHPAAGRALARGATSAEPFVVTDCTRAEDAVRDAVVVTVGYGRTPHGRVVHQFGPLERPDGAALLRLVLTRARRRLVLVSRLGADDLDGRRLRQAGSQGLRAVLASAGVAEGADVAERAGVAGGAGVVGDAGWQASEPAPRDVLLDDLAWRVGRRGATARRGTGPGEPDVAVLVPGGEAVAVVSDVLAPAPGLSLLDRHVQVAQQMHRQGWRVVRVAAVDLFADPEAVIDRVLGLP